MDISDRLDTVERNHQELDINNTTKQRTPSIRQIASRRRKRAKVRVRAYRRRIYKVFLSATAYRHRLLDIPENAATITLSSMWCDYTAYAPQTQGEYLLNRMRQAELILQRRQRAWEDVYHPGQRELEQEKERLRQQLRLAQEEEQRQQRNAQEEEQRRAWEAFLSGFNPINRRWLEFRPYVTCFGMNVYNAYGYNVRRIPQTDEEVDVIRLLLDHDAQGWLNYAAMLDALDPAFAAKIREQVRHAEHSCANH